MNQPSPDLFPDPPRRPRQRRNRLNRQQRFGVGLIFVAGLFFVVGGIYTYFDPRNLWNRKVDIPLISPEAGPVKERPAVPGGVDVPHRDVTIFDHLGQKDEGATQIEHLLPPAEIPSDKAAEFGGHDVMPPPPVLAPAELPPDQHPAVTIPMPNPVVEQAAPEKVAATPLPDAPPVAASPVILPPKVPEPVKPSVQEAVKPLAKELPPVVESSVKPKAEEKPATVAKTDAKEKPKAEAAQPISGTQQRVQLAALPNQEQAEGKLLQIVSNHADLMRQVKLSVVKADLGAKGIFYRIQSQPLAAVAARKLCTDLKTVGVGCILVK
jgi:hypothetical protein